MFRPFQSQPSSPTSTFATNQMLGVDLPLPVVQRGWLHSRELVMPWDAERIIQRVGDGCWFSHYARSHAHSEAGLMTMQPWSFAGFWPAGGFIELYLRNGNPLDDHPRGTLCVYAATPAAAEALMAEMLTHYLREDPAAQRPRIGMLNDANGELGVERITVTEEQLVPRERVDLYYGAGMAGWIDEWIRRLNARRYGLTVLTGAPGTGKTTLMRSLAHWLGTTHQFYFMPASRFGAVDGGAIVAFWAAENRNSKLRKVLILEDAESLLLVRGDDNRDKVATLLNLTDGMLGDALGVHVVCSVNCELADLDPALLRPGRLVAHRDFDLLSAEEAAALARQLGVPPPERGAVSLAEVFDQRKAAPAVSAPRRRSVGFHNLLQT